MRGKLERVEIRSDGEGIMRLKEILLKKIIRRRVKIGKRDTFSKILGLLCMLFKCKFPNLYVTKRLVL